MDENRQGYRVPVLKLSHADVADIHKTDSATKKNTEDELIPESKTQEMVEEVSVGTQDIPARVRKITNDIPNEPTPIPTSSVPVPPPFPPPDVKPDVTPPPPRERPYAERPPEVHHERENIHSELQEKKESEEGVAVYLKHPLIQESPDPLKNSTETAVEVSKEEIVGAGIAQIGEVDLPDMWEQGKQVDDGEKKRETPLASQEEGVIDKKFQTEEMANTVVRSLQEGVGTASSPNTQHAQAVADIAYTLEKLRQNENAFALSPEDVARFKKGYATRTPINLSYKQEKVLLPRMHTFKNDVAQALMKQKTSVAGMVAMTEERKTFLPEATFVQEKNEVNVSTKLFIFGVVCVVGAVGVLGAYFFSQRPVPTTSPESVLVRTDIVKDITIQKEAGEVFSKYVFTTATNINLSKGTLARVNILRFATSTERNTPLSTKEFFSTLGFKAPVSFFDSLHDTFVFGRYEGARSGMFMVFKVREYEQVFSGMLVWELMMREDLRILFSLSDTLDLENANIKRDTIILGTTTEETTTVTSNPAEIAFGNQAKEFSDVVVRNIRARGIRTEDGVSLIWAMPNNTTLVIASNEETFLAVVDHLDF